MAFRAGLLVLAIVFGLVPATAQAKVKKIPSTVGFTDVVNEADLLLGQVESESGKCLKQRTITLSGSEGGSFGVESDSSGHFEEEMTLILEELDGDRIDATLEKGKKFGKPKKQCSGDEAKADLERATVSIPMFSYDDGANAFVGSMTSSDGECIAEVPIGLYYSGSPTDAASTSLTGEFSFSNSAPIAGSYSALAISFVIGDFHPNGNAELLACPVAYSDAVVISR